MLPDQTDGERRGLQMAELANAMVRIYKEQFGRGPTKSHSGLRHPQHASEPEFVDSVERITGRRVRAFVSGTDTQHDVSSEVFYLQPVAPGALRRAPGRRV